MMFEKYTPVPILDLSPTERALLDFDLLIQQRELVIATDQLRPEDVALAQHQIKLLFLTQALCRQQVASGQLSEVAHELAGTLHIATAFHLRLPRPQHG